MNMFANSTAGESTTNHPADADVMTLHNLLRMLLGAQTDLASVLRSKLDAMRRADVDAMQSATADEAALIDRLSLLDAQRHAIAGRLASRFGSTAAPLRMSQVIGAIAEPMRSDLAAVSDALRRQMLAVADANDVVRTASREMTEHFRAVFESLTQAASEVMGYSRRGRSESQPACLLDAVG